MKLNLEILNYESDSSDFVIKIIYGEQQHQTQVGNHWNHKYLLSINPQLELKLEVWKLQNKELNFIGDVIVPIIPKQHSTNRLNVIKDNITQGVLAIEYSVLNSQQKKNKLEKPQKLVQKLNESLTNDVNPNNFTCVKEYFEQAFQNIDIYTTKQAKQIIEETFAKTMRTTNISLVQSHLDENDNTIIDHQRIKRVQKQLIKNDLQKYEKNRYEVHLQILDLDEMDGRFELYEQKQEIQILRKELVQKLLYIEDKIEHLKRHLKLDIGQISNNDLSQISIIYKNEKNEKIELDPQKEQQRQEFIKKQIQEWNNLQEQRMNRIQQQEEKLQKTEQKIKEQQNLVLQAKTKEKIEEIEQRLEQLKEKRQKRTQELQEQNKIFQEKKKQQYLAIKYAQQDAQTMLEIQEQRKNKLKEIKKNDFDIKEINSFDKKIKELRKEKAVVRQKQWEEREQQWRKFQSQYYSKSYKEAILQAQTQEEEKKEKLQERINIVKSYENEIRQRYQPHISQEKKNELEENIRKLKYEPNFKKYRELSEKLREKHIYYGIETQQIQNQKLKLKPLEKIPTPISPKRVGDFYLKEQNAIQRKKNPHLPKIPEPPKSSQSEQKLGVKDYLREQRIKKELLAQQSVKNVNQTLDIKDYKMIEQIKLQLSKLDNI